MSSSHARRTTALLALAAAALCTAGTAADAAKKASHKEWPKIDGKLIIHKHDEETPLRGVRTRHNELLGGHGNDTILAGAAGDVLWGDYQPSGQPATQRDVKPGGPGKDR